LKQPETDMDIGINVHIARNLHTAWWGFEGGRHFIDLNVGPIWDESSEIVEKHRGYSILEDEGCEKYHSYDAYVDAFAEVLHQSFLTELVCIERRRQGLRMNHPRCEPCCLARVVAFMVNHVNVCLRYSALPTKAGAA